MPDVLLEIGTEELPPSAAASGERQLGETIARLLADGRLAFTSVETFSTPRRLAVLAHDVGARQAPAVSERRGPPAAQAYLEDGSYAPAAVGFARANGVEPGDLVRRDTPQGEYLFAVQELPGEPARDVLPALLEEAITALQFPRSMRWNRHGARFARPVRWLVALYGDDVLPLSFAGLPAGRASRGHRVTHPGEIDIPAPSAYEATLREAGVDAVRDARRESVRVQAEKAAGSINARPVVREHVLDEVTDLVERPHALVGEFDRSFLEVPRDVLVVAMESHQRYFPLESSSGELVAGFVVVANGEPPDPAVVVAGNQTVLRARLEDARFFFLEDLKLPLSARSSRLQGIVVHAELGTMRDKALRTGVLLGRIVDWMGLDESDADAAFAAADVCKCDLTTHLVYEFPELQGFVGAEYALRDPDLPLREKVAAAIREHYLPRYAGDDLPATPAGAALGLADRLDTLVGYLGLGLAPTGSEDPYALRRQATGFCAIAMEAGARVPLREAIAEAAAQYARAGVALARAETLIDDLVSFLAARARAQLERDGVRPMLVEAAANARWNDLADMAARAEALEEAQRSGSLHGLAVAHERCFNLSRGGPHGAVDESLLGHESEQNLFGQLQAVEEIAAERAAARDYRGALRVLVPLSEVVASFFEGVLVMDPDESIQRNRKALLERVAAAFDTVADFSVVIPALLAADAAD
jgi:glycyl-tRNA synthetase beta chain